MVSEVLFSMISLFRFSDKDRLNTLLTKASPFSKQLEIIYNSVLDISIALKEQRYFSNFSEEKFNTKLMGKLNDT